MAGDPAVGMIEVQGVAAAIVGADAACKAADVQLVGWSSIGGYTTAFFTDRSAMWPRRCKAAKKQPAA